MKFFEVRRVRLRPEYAHLYPKVVPNTWMSARRVTRLIRKGRTAVGPSVLAGSRVITEEHFEFRGGARGRQYLTGIWVSRILSVGGRESRSAGSDNAPGDHRGEEVQG
jgi:hypothetical protein